MNYSELIHNYLERELDPIAEEKLFNALNSNDELRKEFKNQIKIDKAFSQKLSSFVPSCAATTNLFAKLGINLSAFPPALAQSTIPKKNGFFRPLNKIFISGLISATLTAGIFLLTFKDKLFDSSETFVKSTPSQSTYQESQSAKAEIIQDRQTDNILTDNISQTQIKKQQIISEPIITTHDDDTITISQIPEEQAIEVVNNEYFEQYTQTEPVIYETNFSQQRFGPLNQKNQHISRITPNIVLRSPRNLNGIRLELNSSQYFQLPKAEIAESWIPAFHNNGIAISYKLNDKFKIGSEFRNEHFYQKFEGTDELGNKFRYYQFPNYPSLSIFSSYNFLNSDFINGFVQLSAGGTITGAMGRFAIGAEFEPSPYYTFTFKIETSVLHFMHQNNHFFSPKIGLNYGIGLNL